MYFSPASDKIVVGVLKLSPAYVVTIGNTTAMVVITPFTTDKCPASSVGRA